MSAYRDIVATERALGKALDRFSRLLDGAGERSVDGQYVDLGPIGTAAEQVRQLQGLRNRLYRSVYGSL